VGENSKIWGYPIPRKICNNKLRKDKNMNRERVTKLIQFILFMSFENKLRLLNEMLNSEDVKDLKINKENAKKLVEKLLNMVDGSCSFYITHLKSCSNITMAMSEIMIMDEEEQNLICY